MAAHNSPSVPFSSDAEFPIQVDNLKQFQSLLDSFKHRLFLTLTSAEHISSSSSIKILETKTYKIGKLTLKRTEKTITDPEEVPLPNPIFSPDEYTIEDLWTVLAKQGKVRKLRVLLIGRKVKSSLATSIMNKISKNRRIRPIINREDTAKWVTIRKAVFDKLTEEQKAEWGLLSGLMVVSRGGKLLDLDRSDKKREVIQEKPQLQRTPTNSSRSTTKPVINISTPHAHSTNRTDEYPQRPGNIPRVRKPSTAITTELQPAMAALEERVRQLEIGSRPPVTAHAQMRNVLATNSPQESAGSSYGSEDDEDGEDREDNEDDDEWSVETQSQSDHSLSKLSDSSIGSLRNECMSPVDWVAFAKG